MYNILISLGVSALIFAVVMAFGFPVVSAVLPALLVFPVLAFFLARRTQAQVTADLAVLPGLIEERKLDEVKQLIEQTREKYGKWQPLLTGRLTGQLGMLDYAQMKYDEALPQLEAGSWQDWNALTLIGCIHYRRKRYDEAWESFGKAQKAGRKEVMAYVVPAVLQLKQGLRSEALSTLNTGLGILEGNQTLKNLKNTIANKGKVDTRQFGEVWFQYFPEEAVRQMNMRGTRGRPEIPKGVKVRGQTPHPQPRSRGKLGRRR